MFFHYKKKRKDVVEEVPVLIERIVGYRPWFGHPVDCVFGANGLPWPLTICKGTGFEQSGGE